MPLLEGHDFVALGGLHVAYRASRAPQVLRIHVATPDRTRTRSAPIIVKRLLELINSGAAGGAQFAPHDGHAERLSGPWDGPDAFGPEYSWVLRVSSVAPLFMRTLVDQLRRCGWDQPVTEMRIEGELAPNGDALSVTTERVQEWLARPDAYVEAWPHLSFAVYPTFGMRTRWQVGLIAKPSAATIDALKLLSIRWLVATASYVDDSAQPVLRSREQLEKHLPQFVCEGSVVTVTYEEFHHRAQASLAVLVNMLSRLSETQAPVSEVRFEHPALSPYVEPRGASDAPAKTRPAPSAAKAKPAPSTAKAKPAPSTAKAKPAPSTAKAKPAPGTAKAKPAPGTAKAKPTAAKPAPKSPARKSTPKGKPAKKKRSK